MRQEIRISGFGGQGVMLAGFLLGKALSLYQDLEAVMTQSYGPEARGGASSASIVVADYPIAYPFVQKADVLIALSQEAYSRYRGETKPEGVIVIDEGLVTPKAEDQILAIPATKLAENLGRRIVANVVILGYFCAISDVVTREAMEEAIQTTVKPRTLTLNLEAFEAGFAYAKDEVRGS
ncbi:MAG: 2-oxoacid:acceptor oxidoreductase family protein [Anaerolineales bacterium]